MTKNTSFAIRDFTLDPGDEMTISRTSDFLMCLEASNTFKVAFDDASDWDDFLGGLTFRPLAGFNKVSIYNPTAAAVSVKLGFGKGDVKDARLNLSGSITTIPDALSLAASWYFIDIPMGDRRNIATENASRKGIGIHNDGPGRIWVAQFGTVSAGFVVPMDAGEKMTFPTYKAIYAWAETDAAKVSHWEYSA